MTRVGILGAPRPYPDRQRWLAPAAGALVIALALPLFLVADWPLKGWAAAALLWIGAQALGLLLARVKPSPDNLAASGVLAFGMMARLLIILAVLLELRGRVEVAAREGRRRQREEEHRRSEQRTPHARGSCE